MKKYLVATMLVLASARVLAAQQEGAQPPKAEWQGPVERPKQGNFVGEPGISPELMTEGFLSAHPDLRWRREGLHSYANQRYAEAMDYFLRAARYGDKPAQAMIAEMYWKGLGVPQDRELAYAWMDLAAERGYEGFASLRERYWSELTPAERESALHKGQATYAEYGDDMAQPRLERVLRREQRRATGSRTGFTGSLQIIVPGPEGSVAIDGSKFYDKRFWDPVEYRAWHDAIWLKPRIGRVSVGDMVQLPPQQTETPAEKQMDHDRSP